MLQTLKTYSTSEALAQWTIERLEGVQGIASDAYFALADFAEYDATNKIFKNINGFFVQCKNGSEFYIDVNALHFIDGKKCVLPMYSHIIAFCPLDLSYYIIRVDEDTKTIVFKK